MEKLESVCGSCHRAYTAAVQHKYHWKDFDGVSGRSWCDLSTEELRNAMNRIYIEHYLTPRRVLRRIARIRNLYDVKENWRQFKAFLSRYAATGLPRPIGTPFGGQERA